MITLIEAVILWLVGHPNDGCFVLLRLLLLLLPGLLAFTPFTSR